jgi:hypothetical protein
MLQKHPLLGNVKRQSLTAMYVLIHYDQPLMATYVHNSREIIGGKCFLVNPHWSNMQRAGGLTMSPHYQSLTAQPTSKSDITSYEVVVYTCIITVCKYDDSVSKKSIYQSKPCVQSLPHDNIKLPYAWACTVFTWYHLKTQEKGREKCERKENYGKINFITKQL